jgi:uncharacterized repeat protein (TIGR01451 family)
MSPRAHEGRPGRLFPAAIALLALRALAPSGADAASVGARVTFAEEDFRIESANGAPVARVRDALPEDGTTAAVAPGRDVIFYVPAGSDVRSVRVIPRSETVVAQGGPGVTAEEDVNEAGVSLGGGNLGGFRVHAVRLSPFRRDPGTGDLILARELDVELDLAPGSAGAGEVRRLRPSPDADETFLRALRAMVANPDDIPEASAARAPASGAGGFAPEELPSVEGSGVDMVIVTSAALAPGFQPLADWKTAKGVPAVVRTVEWIEANYPAGRDQPERVRMFLRDAYEKWGVYLVLLGGDAHIMAPRLAWDTYFWGGRDIATDQYFACLDGDWNADGDHLWGEGVTLSAPGDDADLYPDVFVGRIPVEDSLQVATAVAKSLLYDKAPPVGYVEDHLALGEVLFPSSWEFGVDSLSVIALDGKTLIVDSLSSQVPPAWTATELYQSDNTENRALALAALNAGHHLVSIMGHGDAFKFSVGNGPNPQIQIADTDALANGDRLMVVVATACNPNEFDLECQGESFLNNPNGGAIAVFGPSRADFPYSAASFHATMYAMIFGNGITRLGAANQLCRLRYVPNSLNDSTADRWTSLTKMLMGDPELRIWTQEPEGLVVSHAGSVPLGTPGLTVTVQDSSFTAVAGALVCVSDGAGTYSRGLTDGAGMVTLPLTSTQTGTLDVVATLAEHRPHESTVTLGAAAGAHLAPISESIDDDGSGSSSGNGDGVLDAGETIELGLTVRNGGTATATGASVQGTIEAGGSATFDLLYGGVADPSKVFVGPGRVNPGAIPFTLDFASPAIDYIGRPHFTFAPDPLASVNKGDTGIFVWQDHDGWHVAWGSGKDAVTVSGTVATDGRVRRASGLALEPGDTAAINAGQDTLSFSGATGATDGEDGVDFALSDGTMVNLTTSSAALGSIAPAGQAAGTLVLGVAGTARAGQVAYVDLTLTSSAGGPWSGEVPLVISGPELEAYVFAVADSGGGLSGDGDGVVEVGETVRLTPTVINRGNGAAVAVNGAATAASGITLTDAADAYGEIGSLGESAGADGYVFTVDDGTGTTLDLTLTDSLGRTWMKTMDFVAPVAPDSVWFTSTPDRIDFQWDTTDSIAAADLAGYNVYRSVTPGSGHAKQNFELLRTGSAYADEGLVLGSAFYYYATAVDSSGNESAPSAEIQGWTTQVQVAGWPQLTAGFIFPGMLLADGDRDGVSEVYVGSHDFDFYGWNHDGTVRPEFPLATSFQVWSTAAFGDIDEDGAGEIVFGGYDARCYALESDGSPVFGSTPYFVDLSGTGAGIRSAVTLYDVDGDDHLEILFGTELGNLYGFNHDGSPLGGGTGLLRTVPGGLGARIWGTIAVGDLDGDGTAEIGFGSWNDSLYVVRADGSNFPGFPKGTGGDLRGGPTMGDLDNDGTLEILVGSFDGKLYAWNHDGSPYAGGVLATLTKEIGASIALADVDGDPELEIFFGGFDGTLYALNHDGSSFRPGMGGVFVAIDAGAQISACPIVVDVDGDSSHEVFVGHRNGRFYGFHLNGSSVIGMPIPTGDQIFSTAAAGDIDGDGDVDVAFASYDASVNILDFPGASTPEAYEWATLGGNNYRTAKYGDVGPVTAVAPGAPAPLRLAMHQNSPNPFAAGTQIRYVVPADRRVTLKVFNVGGRLVRTLVEGAVPAGPNVVRWDGRDSGGNALSSGIYFYRLQDGHDTITRKGVLLR